MPKLKKKKPETKTNPEVAKLSDEIEDIRIALHEVCSRLTAVSTKLIVLVEHDDIPF